MSLNDVNAIEQIDLFDLTAFCPSDIIWACLFFPDIIQECQ